MNARPTAPLPFDVLQGAGCHPVVLARLLNLTQRDRLDGEARRELEALVGSDPVLCLHLLARTAVPAPTVSRLIDATGLSTLQAMVLRAAWRQLHEAPSTALALNLGQRLIKTALLARGLAESTATADPEQAHLAGLLLFSGQLLMALQGGSEYAQLLDGAGNGRREHVAREATRYNATHTQLGLSMLSGSGLSSPALDALRYHDLPAARLDHAHPLTRLLLLADALAHRDLDAELTLQATRWLSLQPSALHALCARADQAWQDRLAGLARPATDPLREALSLPLLFPIAARSPADAVWHRLRAALESQQGFSRILLFARSADGDTLEAVASPLAQGFRLPLRPGQSLIADALLTHDTRDSYDHGITPESVADEQLARLLDSPGLLCLPFAAGVVVIGIGRDERAQCLAQSGQLHALLNAAARALAADAPPPAAAPPAVPVDVDRRLREARHELAAPLTTLGNYLHLLRDKAPAASEELRILREELSRLRTIVDRLGRAQAPPEAQRVDVPRLLRDVAATEGAAPGRQGITVDVLPDARLPSLDTDPVMLRQILGNLVRNACEALPPGGSVRLESALAPGQDGQPLACLTVTDNGPGLPPAALAQLYDPKPNPRPGHEGLGLVIVKQLADALGAQLRCESHAGNGTRFELQLPAGRSAAALME